MPLFIFHMQYILSVLEEPEEANKIMISSFMKMKARNV